MSKNILENIKKPISDDWEKFRAIRLAGIKNDPQAFGGDLTEELERKESGWRERLESLDRFFFVAENSGVFVALAGAKKTGDNIWMLVSVYTLPEFRGRGLAKALTKKVIEELKSRGAHTVHLMVNIDQKDAVHVYEDAGFEIVKAVKDEKMADGQFHDEYVMEKKFDIL